MNDKTDNLSAPEGITRAWLNRHGACENGWVSIFEDRWPEGAPVTLETAYAALRYGVRPLDVLWVAVRLLPDRQARRDFIVFSLRQRQPYIVKRLRLAGFPAQARAIRAIDWTDLGEARQVLRAAADATYAVYAAYAAALAAAADAADAAAAAAEADAKAAYVAGIAGIDAVDARDARFAHKADAAATANAAPAADNRAARKIYRAQLRWIAERIGAAG